MLPLPCSSQVVLSFPHVAILVVRNCNLSYFLIPSRYTVPPITVARLSSVSLERRYETRGITSSARVPVPCVTDRRDVGLTEGGSSRE